MSWRSGAAAGAVVGLCVGIAVTGTLAAADSGEILPDSDSATATEAAESREMLRLQRLACPVVRPGADRQVAITGASVPEIAGQDEPGRLTVGTLAGGKPRSTVDRPGATAVTGPPAEASAAAATATEGLAPGASAAVVSTDTRGEGKGVASSPCEAPGAEFWLVGGGAGEGQRDVVQLMNPTETDSVVDLSAYGPGGDLELGGDKGITVPAGEWREVRLDAIAPGIANVAVHVRTRVGLITATVLDDRMDGLTPRGTDYIVSGSRPDRELMIPGLPGGAGDRTLAVVAPERGGTLRISAIDESGETPLLADQTIELKRGHVKTVDLTEALGGRSAALRVVADGPIVAAASAATAPSAADRAARADAVAQAEQAVKEAKGKADRAAAAAALAKAETAGAIKPGEDLAWFSASLPVKRMAAVAGLDPAMTTNLMLTADDGEVTVDVGVLPASTKGAQVTGVRSVTVASGRTVTVPLKPPGGEGYTAVVTRTGGEGVLRGSHAQAGSDGAVTGYSLTSLPLWVSLPDVTADYGD